jgi:drug/metabolite transporter (DMT)-like permease
MTHGAFSTGVGLAVVAALSFGVTTPVIAWAGRGVGALTTVTLLYGGAAVTAVVLRSITARSGAPLGREAAARLVAVALVGAVLGPLWFVTGIARAGALAASLTLTFEAPLTVLFARMAYREPVGSRLASAVAAMVVGGILVAFDGGSDGRWQPAGVLWVLGATACWAADNVLSRGLADADPLEVVAAKGLLGAVTAGVGALALRESGPAPSQAVTLVACGATGYGLSLSFYLLSQRRIGAARTGSVFAIAPFVGGLIAWTIGERDAGSATALGAAAFALGVWLHVRERHFHEHIHEASEHTHAHRHDDGHHDHPHAGVAVGEHSHAHRHEHVTHAHAHALDIHHRHRHEQESA